MTKRTRATYIRIVDIDIGFFLYLVFAIPGSFSPDGVKNSTTKLVGRADYIYGSLAPVCAVSATKGDLENSTLCICVYEEERTAQESENRRRSADRRERESFIFICVCRIRSSLILAVCGENVSGLS